MFNTPPAHKAGTSAEAGNGVDVKILDQTWETDTGGDVTLSDGSTLLERKQPSGVTLEESFKAAFAASKTPQLIAHLSDMVQKAKDAGWHPETYETAQNLITAIERGNPGD